MDCNVMWGTRCECRGARLSLRGDPVSASFTQQYERRDLTALLTEVKHLLEPLEVPIKGVISDGQETIGSAVAFVFPGVPHQRRQFHYLKDAIKPFYEADRHAKALLKKQMRGVRPIERALEEQSIPENEAIRDYCLAVRASLTDDGRSPLEADGHWLYDRLTRDSATRLPVCRKKRLPPSLKQLQQLLTKGLQATATLWPPLQHAYRFVHQAKTILANPQQDADQHVREEYLARLSQKREEIATLGPLASAFEHVCQIADNFAAGLFQCSDVEGLARTYNDLEHCRWRWHECISDEPRVDGEPFLASWFVGSFV